MHSVAILSSDISWNRGDHDKGTEIGSISYTQIWLWIMSDPFGAWHLRRAMPCPLPSAFDWLSSRLDKASLQEHHPWGCECHQAKNWTQQVSADPFHSLGRMSPCSLSIPGALSFPRHVTYTYLNRNWCDCSHCSRIKMSTEPLDATSTWLATATLSCPTPLARQTFWWANVLKANLGRCCLSFLLKLWVLPMICKILLAWFVAGDRSHLRYGRDIYRILPPNGDSATRIFGRAGASVAWSSSKGSLRSLLIRFMMIYVCWWFVDVHCCMLLQYQNHPTYWRTVY